MSEISPITIIRFSEECKTQAHYVCWLDTLVARIVFSLFHGCVPPEFLQLPVLTHAGYTISYHGCRKNDSGQYILAFTTTDAFEEVFHIDVTLGDKFAGIRQLISHPEDRIDITLDRSLLGYNFPATNMLALADIHEKLDDPAITHAEWVIAKKELKSIKRACKAGVMYC